MPCSTFSHSTSTMCRSTDYYDFYSLKIKSFFVRLSGWPGPLPESLTLLYLPRISEAALEVSGLKIRPDSPAFVTLHRVVGQTDAIYGCREWVRAGDGIRFEVYSWEDKLLKGTIRRGDDGNGMTWKVECKCALQTQRSETAAVEVCVAVEGHAPMTERVEMKRRRRRKNGGTSFDAKLEEIPEERERETECEGGCCCSCGERAEEAEGESEGGEMAEMEGVGWAVDVGIWVLCLGVGYLVSKASSKSLRRMRIF